MVKVLKARKRLDKYKHKFWVESGAHAIFHSPSCLRKTSTSTQLLPAKGRPYAPTQGDVPMGGSLGCKQTWGLTSK